MKFSLITRLVSGWVTLFLVSTAAAAEPLGGPSFPRIANVYGTALTQDGGKFYGGDCTLEAVAQYDLLVGVRRPHSAQGGKLFREQMRTLKKFNPHLVALHFACSAPYTHIAPTKEALASRQPGQLLPWLLQTDGTPIAGWPGTYMLNMAVPGVVEWLAHQTLPAVKQIGYDGVFIDCMGAHFDSWACEIATGKPYTVDFNGDGKDDDRDKLREAWTDAKTKLAVRVRELLGDKAVFMANQAGRDTYDQLNGIYLEDYIDAVPDRGMSWDRVLEQYLLWTKTPHQPNVTVLGCSSGVEPPFEAFKLPENDRAQYLEKGRTYLKRMRFGLATTLMGDGYYSFDLHTRWRGQYWWYPEFDAPLGYPKTACREHCDGTWRRPFDGGLVVVNPTNWDVALKFQKQHRDLSSGQIAQQFVVPRLDGRIYLPDDGPMQPGTLPSVEPLLTPVGPAGVVERDDHLVMRDGNGLAILVGKQGVIESLSFDGQELLNSIEPIIVSGGKWHNFDTSDLGHRVEPDGTLTITGKRTFNDQSLGFTQTVSVADGCIQSNYQWRAETPLQLKAFRQCMRFSPKHFGGSVVRIDENRDILLPRKIADESNLGKGFRSATLPFGAGQALAISMTQTAQLIDDRHYNGPGYLLAFYPIAGEVPEAREWSYSIEIRVSSAHE